MKKAQILVMAVMMSLGLMGCSSSGSGSSSGIKLCIGSGTCKTTADCGTGLVCDSDGDCVPCLVDADCASSLNRGCNTSMHTCKLCNVDGDCGNATMGLVTGKCGSNFTCDGCTVDADCSNSLIGKVCGPAKTCVECKVDSDCTTATFGPGVAKCGSYFFCNGCTVDADCSNSFIGKLCGPAKTCVECKVDSDCGTGKKCYRLGDFGSCLALCTKDADCSGIFINSTNTNGAGFLCNTGTGECVCDETACKTAHPSSYLTYSCQ
jgi:Cys-rich repeat protein